MTYQGWLEVFSELRRRLRFVWHPAPHMPILKQSFKISNFRKIKKGRGRFCISANLGWFKVCFLSSGGQYASFGTPQTYCRAIFSKNSFSSNFANFTIFAIWAKFVHLRASTRTITCSGGQYASFGTPHA